MNNNKKWLTILAAVMAGILALSLLLSLFAVSADAASSSEIRDQIEELEEEKKKNDQKLAELEKNLAENNEQIDNMIDRKDGIDQQIALLAQQVETINQTISAHNLMIADTQDDLDQAEQKLELLQEAYRDRIRAMEEQGEISYWSVIFKAQSFADLLDRLNMIAEIAHADQMRMDQMRQLAEQITQKRQQLESEKTALEVSRQELKQTSNLMENKRLEADGLLLALVAKGQQYEYEMDESEEMQHNLMDKIAQAEKEFDKAKYQEWLATSVPPTTLAPTTNPAGNGNEVGGKVWYTPTKDFWISSKFGNRWHPITGKWTMHKGIDMAAPTGTPIYATRAGIVTVASYEKGGAGWYVYINHGDGYGSIYMHMTRYIVKYGDYVEAGQVIGYVGSSGGSTGPHLHFGISYNGTYVDPLKYIDV